MQEIWKLFGSPRHLVVFEAAARLCSFTKAARELNVQQPAVSVSIRQLEDTLGVALFTRSHKRVALTAAGERLLADVTRAFEQLSRSATALKQLARPNYVTLNASTAFNNYWIMPRLGDLKSKHSNIDLRLQSSDREPDIDSENISLAVRRGDGHWPGCECALIADEAIYPVASPASMAATGNLCDVQDLLTMRLIHLEEPVRERPSWSDWFSHFSVRNSAQQAGLRLNDYALVLQAAMAGEGFAFGWKHLTERLIRQGLLAARTDWTWETGKGFFLVWSATRRLSPEARLVRDWILENRDAEAGLRHRM